jgi:hypothetical protein
MQLAKRMFERFQYFKIGGRRVGLFPVKNDWGTDVISDLHLVLGLRMRGATPPRLHVPINFIEFCNTQL